MEKSSQHGQERVFFIPKRKANDRWRTCVKTPICCQWENHLDFWRNTSFLQFARFRGMYVNNVTVTKLVMWLTCSPPCLLLSKECVNVGGFKVHGDVDTCKRLVFARAHFIWLLRIQPLHVGHLLGSFKISWWTSRRPTWSAKYRATFRIRLS